MAGGSAAARLGADLRNRTPRALAMLAKSAAVSDDAVLRAIAAEAEADGEFL